MGVDLRKEPRFEIERELPARWPGTQTRCVAKDISKHGLFLEMDDPPPVQTTLVVGPPGAEIDGRVVFVMPKDQALALSRRPGVGVEINLAMDPEQWLLRCAEAEAHAPAASAVPTAHAARPPPPRAASFPTTTTKAAAGPAGVAEIVVCCADQETLAVVKAALAADGYDALIAKHGCEALALTMRRRPALVVVDRAAARLDGAVVTEEIRRRAELDLTKVVTVGGAPVLRATHWPDAPVDVGQARRAIDALFADLPPRDPPANAPDARGLAAVFVEIGRRSLEDGRFDAGLAALRYAFELAPTSTPIALGAAQAAFDIDPLRNAGEALSLVDRVIRHDAAHADAYVLKAKILVFRGKKDDARSWLERALVYAPGHTATKELLTALVGSRGAVEAADLLAEAGGDDGEEARRATDPGLVGRFKRLFGKD